MSLLSSDNQAQLFGLDLRAVWQDAGSVARAAATRAPLSWLTPSARVRQLGAGGEESLWASSGGAFRRPPHSGSAPVAAAHAAVEMSAEWLLRHSFRLPRSSVGQAASAARLEALRLSPFAPEDTVWGFVVAPNDGAQPTLVPQAAQASQPAGNDALTVHVVLCARTHVLARLAEVQDKLRGQAPEVWARLDDVPVVLTGFGEGLRERRARVGLGWSLFWLVLALGWVLAMAVTPSLQLRETALDAQAQFAAASAAAAPALAQREALMAANARLKEVDDALASRADPKLALEILTKALDDGVFLTRIETKGRNVSISGQAANATAVVQVLSGVEGIEDVRSTAAATRQPNGTERFTIDFVLKAAPALPAPPAPVADATPPANASTAEPAPAAPAAAAAPPTAATTPTPSAGGKP